MTTKLRTVVHFLRVGLQSPITILLSLSISIASFTVALQANARSVQEAERRVEYNATQTEKLRTTFCGLIQPIAAEAGTPERSSLDEVVATEGNLTAQALGCTPDPTDRR